MTEGTRKVIFKSNRVLTPHTSEAGNPLLDGSGIVAVKYLYTEAIFGMSGNITTTSVSWDGLWKLAVDKESQRIIDQVAPHLVEDALTTKTPCEVMNCLLAVEECHCALRELEQSAAMETVKTLLYSGDFQVRGHDTDGRPVIWISLLLRKWGKNNSKEKLLVTFWAVRWAMRKSSNSHRGIFFVVDDRGRGLLDFDLELMTMLGTMLPKCTIASVEPRAVWILSSTAQKFAIDMLAKLIPTMKNVVMFVSSPDELVDLVSDTHDNDQAVKAAGLTTFQPTFELLGDYQNLLRRQGFAKMNVSDWSRPSLVKVKLVHQDVLKQDNDLGELILDGMTDLNTTDGTTDPLHSRSSKYHWPSPSTSAMLRCSGRVDLLREMSGKQSMSFCNDSWGVMSPHLEQLSELGIIAESDED